MNNPIAMLLAIAVVKFCIGGALFWMFCLSPDAMKVTNTAGQVITMAVQILMLGVAVALIVQSLVLLWGLP